MTDRPDGEAQRFAACADGAPPPARLGEVVLALDAGGARTGLAIARVGSTMAFGRGTIPGGDDARTLDALRPLVQAEGVERLVLGLPLRTDGSDSVQTTLVRRLAGRLREMGLPLELVDERFTTQAAERALRGSGLPRGKRRQKGRVDEASAVLILETWLARYGAGAPSHEQDEVSHEREANEPEGAAGTGPAPEPDP